MGEAVRQSEETGYIWRDGAKIEDICMKKWALALASLAVLGSAQVARAQQTYRIQTPSAYNACNVRSGPSTANSVVGTYRDGQVVTLLGERNNGWYRVQVGNTIGWMARQCLGL